MTTGVTIDLDVQKEAGKLLEVLRRETTNLLQESSKGKLSPTSSRDLVQYIKLAIELADRQDEAAQAAAEALNALKDKSGAHPPTHSSSGSSPG